jgi:YegS/Rv2252/BmrU family lipid kinase
MKILCILNPIAGGGRTAERVVSAIHSTFQETDTLYEIVTTHKKGDATALARKAVKEDYTHVVAIGGDGTVNEVATGLVGTQTTLGVIPVGSGNGLARGLRIPLNFQQACRVVLRGKSKKFDVGQVDDRYFFSTSGIGFDAHVGKHYDEKSSGHSRGLLPYAQIAATEYFNYIPQEVVVHCNEEQFTYTPFILTVANFEQYGGGAIIAPGAIPDDGLFDVSIIPRSSVLQLINHLPKLFLGEIDTFPHFITHKTNALTITRHAPGPVHVDGEPFMAGEVLEYTLLSHALQIQVDEKSDDTRTAKKGAEPIFENVLDLLEKLARLKEKGILTEEEFTVQKHKLLERL